MLGFNKRLAFDFQCFKNLQVWFFHWWTLVPFSVFSELQDVSDHWFHTIFSSNSPYPIEKQNQLHNTLIAHWLQSCPNMECTLLKKYKHGIVLRKNVHFELESVVNIRFLIVTTYESVFSFQMFSWLLLHLTQSVSRVKVALVEVLPAARHWVKTSKSDKFVFL